MGEFRYLLRPTALELFFTDGGSAFFHFPAPKDATDGGEGATAGAKAALPRSHREAAAGTAVARAVYKWLVGQVRPKVRPQRPLTPICKQAHLGRSRSGCGCTTAGTPRGRFGGAG